MTTPQHEFGGCVGAGLWTLFFLLLGSHTSMVTAHGLVCEVALKLLGRLIS